MQVGHLKVPRGVGQLKCQAKKKPMRKSRWHNLLVR